MEEFNESGAAEGSQHGSSQPTGSQHRGPEPKPMPEPKGFDIPLWSKFAIALALIVIATLGYSRRFFFTDESTPAAMSENQDQGPVEDRGKPLDFTVVNDSGKSLALNSVRGKVTVVSFWASWCGPCMAELPTFGALQKQVDSEDLRVWLINVDEPGEAKSIVDRVWSADQFPFPKLFDPNKKAAELLGIDVLPATLVLDKLGRVAMRGSGSNDWGSEKSVELIQSLIAEKL